MKKLSIFLFIILSLSGCTSTNTNYSYSTFKHPPFKEIVGSPFRYVERYDKFKDLHTTLVSVKLNDELSLQAMYVYQVGSKVPKEVSLDFISFTKEWKYLHNSSLILLADGKRYNFPKLERRSNVSLNFVSEYLTCDLSYNDFVNIFNSSTLEGQLFTTEFQLTFEQLEAFRDFADRISSQN